MTGSDYVSLTTVQVDPWSSDGSQNNCWWNIAKNQLGEGATAAEIQALVNELQGYNEDKDAANVRANDVLMDGEAVFIPLEYAAEEIQENINGYKTMLETANSELTAKTETLSAANNTVSEAYSAYQRAQASYENVEANCYDDEGNVISNYAIASLDSVKADLEAAQQAYLGALADQAAAQEEYEAQLEAVESAKANLESAQLELSEILDENAALEDEYNEKIEELRSELTAIEQSISDTEGELAEAQAAYDTAQTQQEAAQSLGVEVDENGNYSADTIDTDVLTSGDLDAANEVPETEDTEEETKTATGVEISEEDGTTTKTVTYEDGTVATFELQEDGTWLETGTDSATEEDPVEMEDVTASENAMYADWANGIKTDGENSEFVQALTSEESEISDEQIASVLMQYISKDSDVAEFIASCGDGADRIEDALVNLISSNDGYYDSDGNEVYYSDIAVENLASYLSSIEDTDSIIDKIIESDETGNNMVNVAQEYMTSNDGNSLLNAVSEDAAQKIVDSYVSAYESADDSGKEAIADLLANDIYMAMKGEGCSDSVVEAIFDGYRNSTSKAALLRDMETAFNEVAATEGGHGKWKSTLYQYMIDQGKDGAGEEGYNTYLYALHLKDDGLLTNYNKNADINDVASDVFSEYGDEYHSFELQDDGTYYVNIETEEGKYYGITYNPETMETTVDEIYTSDDGSAAVSSYTMDNDGNTVSSVNYEYDSDNHVTKTETEEETHYGGYGENGEITDVTIKYPNAGATKTISADDLENSYNLDSDTIQQIFSDIMSGKSAENAFNDAGCSDIYEDLFA
ncbi:MAG: hypothetical protein LUE64_03665 [Candidatus Gastranaerophilales bacterium]|nr:hypothetical protein [Candidatus Gastranaerophilales bacterium]